MIKYMLADIRLLKDILSAYHFTADKFMEDDGSCISFLPLAVFLYIIRFDFGKRDAKNKYIPIGNEKATGGNPLSRFLTPYLFLIPYSVSTTKA
jgi:hypothetical protein